MKWLTVAAIFLLFLGPVLAASPHLQPREGDVIKVITPALEAYEQRTTPAFYVQAYDKNGTLLIGGNATCNLAIFAPNGTKQQESTLSANGNFYLTTISTSVTNNTGTYSFTAWCNSTATSGGFYENFFDVTATGLPWATNEDLTPVAVIVLLPFLLALITIVGSVTLDPEEHPALKIGLFLFSFLPFYVSLWWGAEAIGRFYNFPSLTEAIGSGTFFGIIFFILLVFYVVAYFIWKAIEAAAEKNAKRLTY